MADTAVAFSPDGHTVYDPPRRISGWCIHVCCPERRGTLAHVADSRPEPVISAAVARCIGCGRCYHAEITLTDVTAEIGKRALW